MSRNSPIVKIDSKVAKTEKQRILLEQLNSLPGIQTEQDPVELLREIRKQNRLRFSAEFSD